MSLSKVLPDTFDEDLQTIVEKYKVLGDAPYDFANKNNSTTLRKKAENIDREHFEDVYNMQYDYLHGRRDPPTPYINTGFWVSRVYINYAPGDITIPTALRRFSQRFRECVLTHPNLLNYRGGGSSFNVPHFRPLSGLDVCIYNVFSCSAFIEDAVELFQEPLDDTPGAPNAVRVASYFAFFDDPNSVDNGSGLFFINLDASSVNYGKVYSYSSSDDGAIFKVADSFDEFIHILATEADEFLSGEWTDNDEGIFSGPTSKRLSLCDYFWVRDSLDRTTAGVREARPQA